MFRRVATVAVITLAFCAGGCALRQKPKPQPDLARIFRPAREMTGKTPVIVIPGMLGSRLVNRRTGEKVWPRAHPKEDGLSLPTSPDLKKNRDDVVAVDVVETAKLGFPIPEIKVYEDLTETLATHAGYKRGDIDNPPPGGDRDTFYLFAYDWRRDNVETAQLLAEKIARLKQRLGRPDLRFNLITHSMGGLVARYYMMYGGEDVLGRAEAKVTWAGAPSINKLVLVGAPNEGTMEAVRALVEGFPVAESGLLPLFGTVEAETAFTMPAAFQLLPHRGSQEFYDGSLRAIPLNLYEVETWRRYRWSIFDPSYRKALTKRMQKAHGAGWQTNFDNLLAEREAYLKVVLARARLFAEALDEKADLANPLKVFIFAGDCERTPRAAVIAEEGSTVRTVFRPGKVRLKGAGLTLSQVEAKMLEPGDGRITRRSALAVGFGESAGVRFDRSDLLFTIFGCQLHSDLPNDTTFQDNLLSIFLK
ncbi:MAG: esterase/lipase family protein [Pyrinomonadaceae bacterium]